MDQPQDRLNSQPTEDLTVIQHPTTGRSDRTPYACRWDIFFERWAFYSIAIDFVAILSNIIAVIVGFSLSWHEHPHAPSLFIWVAGNACACVVALPSSALSFYDRYLTSNQDPHPSSPRPSTDNLSISSANATTEAHNITNTTSINATHSARLKVLIKRFEDGASWFSIVWLAVGNVWFFKGHSSVAVDAPNLYRLCLVLLAVFYIDVVIPFIVCCIFFCCVFCIPSLREYMSRNIEATTEFIIPLLPTYKFIIENHKHGEKKETQLGANGTKNECGLCEADAVCCICLANYENNDELRELPCTHIFHKECVDKWLKIKPSCPLCKWSW